MLSINSIYKSTNKPFNNTKTKLLATVSISLKIKVSKNKKCEQRKKTKFG